MGSFTVLGWLVFVSIHSAIGFAIHYAIDDGEREDMGFTSIVSGNPTSYTACVVWKLYAISG